MSEYNLTALSINALHSSATAAAAKSDDAGGLEPVLFLAEKAKVMLTSNLWQQVGLCNGAMGTIEHILYTNGQHPPNLPLAVLVNFNHYSGPQFLPTKPKCIPIPPIIFQWHNAGAAGHTTLSRQQLIKLCCNYSQVARPNTTQSCH